MLLFSSEDGEVDVEEVEKEEVVEVEAAEVEFVPPVVDEGTEDEEEGEEEVVEEVGVTLRGPSTLTCTFLLSLSRDNCIPKCRHADGDLSRWSCCPMGIHRNLPTTTSST